MEKGLVVLEVAGLTTHRQIPVPGCHKAVTYTARLGPRSGTDHARGGWTQKASPVLVLQSCLGVLNAWSHVNYVVVRHCSRTHLKLMLPALLPGQESAQEVHASL